MKDVTIWIPSIGRANTHTTFEDIRGTPWLPRTQLVVPAGEAYDVDYAVICPVQGKGIAKVRQWMVENCPTRYLIMLDDDLKFQYRTNQLTVSGTYSIKRADATRVTWALNWMHNTLKEQGLAQVALTERSRNFAATDETGHDTRAIQAVGIDLKQWHKYDIDYLKKVPFDMQNWVMMTDFHVTLQLLEAGLHNAVSYLHRYGAAASNAPGGCSGMRSVARQRASAELLQANHPRSVTLRTKQNDNWKGALDGKEIVDVKINWKSATKEK